LIDFHRLVKVYDYSMLENLLGPVTADKFINYQVSLINTPIEDYKIMAALSFDGMAEEKWKTILKVYPLDLLFKMNPQQLMTNLTQISGMGEKTVEAIIEGFTTYASDIDYILHNMRILNSKDAAIKPKVALTGFRDPVIIEMINTMTGYDCSDKYSVTKDTAILLTNDKNSTSGKMLKANKYGIPIMTVDEFFKVLNIEFKEF